MSFLKAIWQDIAGFFQADVIPEAQAIEQAFLAQFATPGGQLIFNAATAFLTTLPIGGPLTNIVSAGESVLKSLAGQELGLAESDAQNVALDALRVHLSAASASTTSTSAASGGNAAAPSSVSTVPAMDAQPGDAPQSDAGATS